MKKPLAMTPAAKAGFENGSGMKFGQPRLMRSNRTQRILLLKMKHRNRRIDGLSSTVAARQR
jgi:hypothetical protein